MTDATPIELMTVMASRMLHDHAVCFVGIGLPSRAANLARLIHAPNVVLIYESGTIATRPDVFPLSIGDGDLATHADSVVSTTEIFSYWLQGGRIELGFLGAAQIDRFANLNTTVIGDYARPQVRLPGAGGAPEIATHASATLVMIEHSPRRFVDQVDFVTTACNQTNRYPQGAQDKGHARSLTTVVTDLAVLRLDPETQELIVTQLHAGVSRQAVAEATGWDIRFAKDVVTNPAPTETELDTLRNMELRTRQRHAHGKARIAR